MPHFIEFHEGAATFPWRSQAKWIGRGLALRSGLDLATAAAASARVFRSDIYRAQLKDSGADLPGASEKLEGSIRHETAVAAQSGRLTLLPDAFFDGRIFDPLAE